MTRPYVSGYRFEIRARDILRRLGWHVFRHAGSKFPDLIAVRDGYTVLVEVKKDKKLVSRDKKKMKELASCLNVEGLILYFDWIKSRWVPNVEKCFCPNGRCVLGREIEEWRMNMLERR